MFLFVRHPTMDKSRAEMRNRLKNHAGALIFQSAIGGSDVDEYDSNTLLG